MIPDPPAGEHGTVRLPWDLLPRTAVRNEQGIWIRRDDMAWFKVASPAIADSFKAKAVQS